MTLTPIEASTLQAVREMEQVRIAAIRSNNADVMAQILDDKFIFINSDGRIYGKVEYIKSVRSRELKYFTDVDLTESDYRVDADLVILAGMMLGHAHLQGEQQVFHLRNMRMWRSRGSAWKLMAWQASEVRSVPF